MTPLRGSLTFVVRVSADASGRLRGVVERVRTGERAAFRGRVALGAVIARMVAAGRAPPREPPEEPR
jgi:hypothetical protein